jgi:hypothetical protein
MIRIPIAEMFSVGCFSPQATVNCQNIGSMPEVVFTLSGHSFTVPASAYVSQVSLYECLCPCAHTYTHTQTQFELSGRGLISPCEHFLNLHFLSFLQSSYGCNTGFGGGNDQLWILGDVFIRQFYVIFDSQNQNIGLAQAV